MQQRPFMRRLEADNRAVLSTHAHVHPMCAHQAFCGLSILSADDGGSYVGWWEIRELFSSNRGHLNRASIRLGAASERQVDLKKGHKCANEFSLRRVSNIGSDIILHIPPHPPLNHLKNPYQKDSNARSKLSVLAQMKLNKNQISRMRLISEPRFPFLTHRRCVFVQMNQYRSVREVEVDTKNPTVARSIGRSSS